MQFKQRIALLARARVFLPQTDTYACGHCLNVASSSKSRKQFHIDSPTSIYRHYLQEIDSDCDEYLQLLHENAWKAIKKFATKSDECDTAQQQLKKAKKKQPDKFFSHASTGLYSVDFSKPNTSRYKRYFEAIKHAQQHYWYTPQEELIDFTDEMNNINNQNAEIVWNPDNKDPNSHYRQRFSNKKKKRNNTVHPSTKDIKID